MYTRSKLKYIKKIQKNVKKHLFKRKIYPYKYIRYYYNKYLKTYGCKLPSENSIMGKILEYLYINIQNEKNINDIRNYVISKLNNKEKLLSSCESLQIRHLGMQYGFNLLKSNEIFQDKKINKSNYCLINLKNVYKNFFREKRKIVIDDQNWQELKKEYNFKCATCGNEENKQLRYNSYQITILQKGHMDPRKSLTLDNTIPQCQYCNQQYKNKAIFNKRGVVIDFCKNGF